MHSLNGIPGFRDPHVLRAAQGELRHGCGIHGEGGA